MTGKDSMIRTFIAIELPPPVKQFLQDIPSEFRSLGGDVRWVRAKSMHLTLKFLGEVSPHSIESIGDAAATVFSRASIMELEIRGVGVFPGLNRPRVIWAGLRDRSGRLFNLVRDLEIALEPLGFKRERRPFRPHLTLGRVKGRGITEDLRSAIRQNMDREGPTFTADHAVLFRSILNRSGAEYRVLRMFDFPER